MKNGSNKEDQDMQPMMILTIDIGNGLMDKLQLFDLNNVEQETYDFCVKNKLDFSTMQEINTQIQSVIKDKQLEEEQEIENEFQEIKEEEDEKITDNNINETKDQESIIITNQNQNQNQNEIQKGNKNEPDVNSEKINNKEQKENTNPINNENENVNSINNNFMGNNYNVVKKKFNQSGWSNTSGVSGGNKDHQGQGKKQEIKPEFKTKKKNIKENVKEAIAMAKEKSKQNLKIAEKNIKNKIADEGGIKNNVNDENKNKISEEKNEKENGADNIGGGNNNNISDNNKEGENNINNINKENKKDSEKEKNKIFEEKKNNLKNINEIHKNEINNNNSKEKPTNQKKQKPMSHNSTHISGYNPGKELYDRGMRFKENEKERLEALKKNLEVDEEEDNTFTPKINKLSKMEEDRIRERRPECTNPEIINNYKQYKKDRFENLRKKSENEFNKIYTFKPNINRSYSNTKSMKNKNSDEIKKQENNESRFDKLYNYRIDYKENREKLKEKIYNEISFKPRINESSNYYKFNVPFNERLRTYSNKSKENMIKIQQVYEREHKYNEPFKPRVNNKKNKILLKDRDEFFITETQKFNNNSGVNSTNTNTNNVLNKNNNNLNSIDPYTKLYLYGKKYEQERNFMTEKYYKENVRQAKCSESTDIIINRKKEKSFKQIFKILDGDEDCKISPTHMNISGLPKNIIKILEPIFNELKEENETLNELEFVFVCGQLYPSLPWNDRRELSTFADIERKNIKKEKILKEKKNFTFKPRINKRNYSYDNPIKLIGEDNNNNENNINESNYLNCYNNNTNDVININSYCGQKNRTNKNRSNNIINNNMNKINNRVNFFNIRISNQSRGGGGDILKRNISEYSLLNNKREEKDGDFTILKNININIIGKGSNNNKNEDEKHSKICEKKINYENFVNVKNSS